MIFVTYVLEMAICDRRQRLHECILWKCRIEREDVLACIAYGAEMARDVFVELLLTKKKEASA
ncbi:MAG: hypothetical protein V7K55_13845 [Nostoc sp.]|uniref:hypothetical protein n=1 Tax=Nostoc sp. TaxID=1180 RepID=UPI002FF4D298